MQSSRKISQDARSELTIVDTANPWRIRTDLLQCVETRRCPGDSAGRHVEADRIPDREVKDRNST
eukprot:3940753-Rhodomonas_salina.3